MVMTTGRTAFGEPGGHDTRPYKGETNRQPKGLNAVAKIRSSYQNWRDGQRRRDEPIRDYMAGEITAAEYVRRTQENARRAVRADLARHRKLAH